MPLIPPVAIAAAPSAPIRSVKATFSNSVDNFIQWLIAAVGQFNSLGTTTYANALDAYSSAISATASASASSASANVTAWVSGYAYTSGASVWSLVNFQTYRRRLAGSSSVDPAFDGTTWAIISSSQSLSFKNKVVNGGMQIAQRGVPIVVNQSDAKSLDRWFVFISGSPIAVTRLDLTGAVKALWLTTPADNSSLFLLTQIESKECYDLTSGAFTLSFIVNLTAAKQFQVLLNTPAVQDGRDNHTQLPSGGFVFQHQGNGQQKFTLTYPASLAGSSEAAIRRGLQLVFSFGALPDRNIGLAQVQLEVGEVATKFDFIPYNIELDRCKRFYQKVPLQGFALTATMISQIAQPKVPMFTVPTSVITTGLTDISNNAVVTPANPVVNLYADAEGISHISASSWSTALVVGRYYYNGVLTLSADL